MGLKGCGKTYFLSKVFKDQLEIKDSIFTDMFTFYDLEYGNYKIRFIEVHDKENNFEAFIETASVSDGIILV